MAIEINGKPVDDIDTAGIKPGTVITNGNESIRIQSHEDAEQLLHAAQIILEFFDAN